MPLVYPGEESSENAPWSRFGRHHHPYSYAALVIRGSCEEAGDRGRFAAVAGDVLVHSAFDGHGDTIGRTGAAFINFRLDAELGSWLGRVDDLDSIVRTHAKDPLEATAMLREQFRPLAAGSRDWPDLLAAELATGRAIRLDDWAERHGLHAASVSRGFRKAYGVSPKRYRVERIASTAARRIGAGIDPLGAIAADCGFADQAHMTRALRGLFGVTPKQLRRPS